MFDFIKKITTRNRAEPIKVVEVKAQEEAKPTVKSLNIPFKDLVKDQVHKSVEGALKRGYDAAQASRVVASWPGVTELPNEEIRNAYNTLINRSRDLENNNTYAQKYLALLVSNVVGTGFNIIWNIQELDGKRDDLANRLMRENLLEWSKPKNCDIAKKLSFYDMQRLIVRLAGRDGECIVRKFRDKKINKWGYALQILDIKRLAVDYCGVIKSNGNVVSMGVEMNQYGCPIAYYIYKTLSHAGQLSTKDLERVDANDLVHIYNPKTAEQTRGITWMHSVMLDLEMLSAYMETMLIQQRIATSQGVYYTAPDGDPSAFGDYNEVRNEFESFLEPGKVSVLPPGWSIQHFTPEAPGSYSSYIKTQLQAIASGLKVSYFSLANDLEGVSYSSIRAGVLEDRDNYIAIQDWLISWFLEGVISDWVTESINNGAITYPTGAALPVEKLKKFNSFIITGRRWSWVDPEKEMNAAKIAIDTVTGSRQSVLANLGYDYDDVLTQVAYEQERIRELNIFVPGFTDVVATNNTVSATKSLEQNLNDVKRSVEEMRSTPQQMPNISVEAPQISLQPIIKMPGSITKTEVVRDARGLITGVIHKEELEQKQETEQEKEGT